MDTTCKMPARRTLELTTVAAIWATCAFFGIRSDASASVGVGIGAAPIEVRAPVRPGGKPVTTSVYVVNTGDETTTYVLGLHGPKVGERQIPERWVRFQQQNIVLKPLASARVTLTIAAPKGAKDGIYRSAVTVASADKTRGSEIGVGAAAETALRFRVANGGFRFPDPLAKLLLIVAGTAGAFVLFLRTGIRVRIERS